MSLRQKTRLVVFVATKVILSRLTLSPQNYVCRRKCLSPQKFCREKNMFVVTNVLSRQTYFCRDKRRVLSRKKWYLWQLPPMIGQEVGRVGKNFRPTLVTLHSWLPRPRMISALRWAVIKAISSQLMLHSLWEAKSQESVNKLPPLIFAEKGESKRGIEPSRPGAVQSVPAWALTAMPNIANAHILFFPKVVLYNNYSHCNFVTVCVHCGCPRPLLHSQGHSEIGRFRCVQKMPKQQHINSTKTVKNLDFCLFVCCCCCCCCCFAFFQRRNYINQIPNWPWRRAPCSWNKKWFHWPPAISQSKTDFQNLWNDVFHGGVFNGWVWVGFCQL